MKLRILLSLLFIIATTFISVHELQHIQNGDDSQCLVCHIGDNLASADVIDVVTDVEIIHAEKVLEKHSIVSYYEKKTSNQNRAPPKKS